MTDDPTVPGQDPNVPNPAERAQPPQEPTSVEKPPTDAQSASPYDQSFQPPAAPSPTVPTPTDQVPTAQASTGQAPTEPTTGQPAASPMYPTPPGATYPAPGTYSAGAAYPATGATAPTGANPAPGAYPPPGAAPVGQYPAGQYPPAQYPAGQYPAGQYPTGQHPPAQYPAGQYPAPGTYPDAKEGWGNGKILALIGAIVLLLGAGGIGGFLLLNGKDDAQDGAAGTSTTTTTTTAQTPLRIPPASILPTEAQIESAGLQHLIKTSPEPGTGLTAAAPTIPTGCEYVVEPYNEAVFGPAVALARYNYTNTGNTKTYAVYAQAKAAVFEDASAAIAAVSKISSAVNNPDCTSFRVTGGAAGKDARSTKPGASEEGKVFWTVGFPGESWNCSHDMQAYRNIVVFGSWCNYANTSTATQVTEEMIKNIKAKAPN